MGQTPHVSPKNLAEPLVYKKHQDRLHERSKNSSDDYRQSQWEAFAKEAESELNIPHDLLSSAVARTARTGLYVLSFSFPASNRVLGNGYTSPQLINFLNWIQQEDVDSAEAV